MLQSSTVEAGAAAQGARAPAGQMQRPTRVVSRGWLKHVLITDEEWQEGELVPDPPRFVQALRQNGPRGDLFSFGQWFSDPRPRHPYHFEMDNAAAIPVTSHDDWWKKLSQESRRNVRIAEKKGVTVKAVPFSDELVAGIKEIHDETPIRQGKPFKHYGKDFETVKRDHATFLDRCEFIAAHAGSELIGFIKMVYVNDAAKIMQILSKNAHFEKKPGNALIARAVEVCAARGTKYLVYLKYVYGRNDQSTLLEFKRRNGFERFDFPRYYIPLSLKGSLGLKCGLHEGLAGALPPRLADFLVRQRARLYEARYRKQARAAG